MWRFFVWIKKVIHKLGGLKVVDIGLERYNNGDAWEVVDRSGDNSPFLWISSSEIQTNEISIYFSCLREKKSRLLFHIYVKKNLKNI